MQQRAGAFRSMVIGAPFDDDFLAADLTRSKFQADLIHPGFGLLIIHLFRRRYGIVDFRKLPPSAP